MYRGQGTWQADAVTTDEEVSVLAATPLDAMSELALALARAL
jgi:hypothetical protein